MVQYNKPTIKETRKITWRVEDGKLTEHERVSSEKKHGDYRVFSGLGSAAELGFTISLPLVGAIAVGTAIDRKFSSFPKGTLSFLFLGVFISLGQLILFVKTFAKKKK